MTRNSPAMRMALMRKSEEDRRERERREREYPDEPGMPEMAYRHRVTPRYPSMSDEPYMESPVMMRHRDRRGRYMSYEEPSYDERRMGFERLGTHYGRESRDDEEYPRHGQQFAGAGAVRMDHHPTNAMEMTPLTMDTAEAWVAGMTNEDPAKPQGGKWTQEEVKPFAKRLGIVPSGQQFAEFYAVMNAMYSDYSEVAKRFGVTQPDFFAEMAKAFMLDKDAKADKVSIYYNCIADK